MKNRLTIAVLSGLLGLSMLASYATVSIGDGAETAEEGVAVYVASAEKLQRIAYSDNEERSVVVERKSDALGPYLWVTVTEKMLVESESSEAAEGDEAPAEGDDGDASESGESPDGTESPEETSDEPSEGGDEATDEPVKVAPEPVYEMRTVSFKGSDQADKLWEEFAPFRALRKLETTDATGDFGIEEPEARVEVTRGTDVVELALGDKTFGGRNRYLGSSGATYLVNSNAFVSLKQAKTKLPERKLHPVEIKSADQVVLQKGEVTRVFTQQNKDDRAKAYWADSTTPQVKDALAGAWLVKLFAAGIQVYVDEIPAEAKPVFDYRVVEGDKSWSVAILEAPGEGGPEYFVDSAFCRGKVKLVSSRASDLVTGVDEVLAPRRSSSAPPPAGASGGSDLPVPPAGG